MLARSSWMTFALRCALSTPRLACHAKHVHSCISNLSRTGYSCATAHTCGSWQVDTAEALSSALSIIVHTALVHAAGRGQVLYLL